MERRGTAKVKLAGRAAVVTGAGRGIGRAVAESFAREGARVVAVARTRAELEQVVRVIEGFGGTAAARVADVTDAAAARDAVRRCIDEFGRLDVLVNAAGAHGPIGPAWEADVTAWTRAAGVNLFGTFHCCHAAIPGMVEAGGGRIINFSGGGATAPMPRFTAYAASKAAVVRLTETLAEELKALGVTVNAIAPGAVDTRLQDDVLAAGDRAGPEYERVRRMRASGEGGVPATLAAALAVFLASDAAGRLTGKLISAAHDGWDAWDAERITALMERPWLTLRRLDDNTLRLLDGGGTRGG